VAILSKIRLDEDGKKERHQARRVRINMCVCGTKFTVYLVAPEFTCQLNYFSTRGLLSWKKRERGQEERLGGVGKGDVGGIGRRRRREGGE
jgi:cytochrome c-type biogenesis protein CcmE